MPHFRGIVQGSRGEARGREEGIMYAAVRRALEEAARRWKLRRNGDHSGGQTLETAWTGLGNRTAYGEAIEAGYMEWACGEPAFRCMGWLRLTAKGAGYVECLLERAPAQVPGGCEYELMPSGRR